MTPETATSGPGRVVVGRYKTGIGDHYTTVNVDELLFFNQPLSIQEIQEIINLT